MDKIDAIKLAAVFILIVILSAFFYAYIPQMKDCMKRCEQYFNENCMLPVEYVFNTTEEWNVS